MDDTQKPPPMDDRTEEFARRVRAFVRRLPRTVSNRQDVRQLVRSSGSVGANYIEANESLGQKDFALHLRIARKEAKETRYWLRLVYTQEQSDLESERASLVAEATELLKILSKMIQKAS
jgi:four helix bundle protein